MVKVKKVRIVLPVEGKKSYKDILELLSDENEFILEKKESVKQVLKEIQVEGVRVDKPLCLLYHKDINQNYIMYLYRFEIKTFPDGSEKIEFAPINEYLGIEYDINAWGMEKDFRQKILQRFQKAMQKHPRLLHGDNVLGLYVLSYMIDENGILSIKKVSDKIFLMTNESDILDTLNMSVQEYNEYLKRQKEKEWKEQEVEKEKELTRIYYENLEKEKELTRWLYEQKQKEREKLRGMENKEK